MSSEFRREPQLGGEVWSTDIFRPAVMNVAVVGVIPVVGEAGIGRALPMSMERDLMCLTVGVSGGEGGNLKADCEPRSSECAIGDVAKEKSLNGDSLAENDSRRR